MAGSGALALIAVCGLTHFVCWVIILVDAFKNEWWKGLLCLFCSIYMLYYGFAEFENEKKPLVLGLWLGSFVLMIGVSTMMPHATGGGSFAPASP